MKLMSNVYNMNINNSWLENGDLKKYGYILFTNETFQDNNFQTYLSQTFNYTLNDKITADELSKIKKISCQNMGIKDLTGLKFFYNLENLNCAGNQIKYLNLENFNNLKSENINFGAQNIIISHYKNENKGIINCPSEMDTKRIKNLKYINAPDAITIKNDSIEYNPSLGDFEYTYATHLPLNPSHTIKVKIKIQYLDSQNLNEDISIVSDTSSMDEKIQPVPKNENYILSQIFPDQKFRDYIINNFKTENYESEISQNQLDTIIRIDCSNMEIFSVQGIEYCTNLKIIICNNNKIETIDLSKNTKLEYFDCSFNNLNKIILNDQMPLKYFNYSCNYISSFINCPKGIEILECGNNLIKGEIILNERYASLKELHIGSFLSDKETQNRKKIDFQSPTIVDYFTASGFIIPQNDEGEVTSYHSQKYPKNFFYPVNKIQQIIIDSSCSFSNFKVFSCIDNILEEIPQSILLNAVEIYCRNNLLNYLRIYPQLKRLNCDFNKIKYIYLATYLNQNFSLEYFSVGHNEFMGFFGSGVYDPLKEGPLKFEVLDRVTFTDLNGKVYNDDGYISFTKFPKLYFLDTSYNSLFFLYLGDNPELNYFYSISDSVFSFYFDNNKKLIKGNIKAPHVRFLPISNYPTRDKQKGLIPKNYNPDPEFDVHLSSYFGWYNSPLLAGQLLSYNSKGDITGGRKQEANNFINLIHSLRRQDHKIMNLNDKKREAVLAEGSLNNFQTIEIPVLTHPVQYYIDKIYN